MRLTVVGSAPAYALRPGASSSSYLVEDDASGVLLDLGQGSFAALHAYRRPESLDAVLISHLHPDHHIDLIPLRHYLRYAGDEPASVRLLAPRGLRERIEALMGEPGFLAGLPGDPLQPGVRRIGSLEVEASRVTHIPEAFAFRIATPGRRGLVYSGDCGRADDLLPLVREGDVLLCEASWGSADPSPGGLHLSAADAARVAEQAGASRLLLTHVLERFDAAGAVERARAGLAIPVELAGAGMQVDIA